MFLVPPIHVWLALRIRNNALFIGTIIQIIRAVHCTILVRLEAGYSSITCTNRSLMTTPDIPIPSAWLNIFARWDNHGFSGYLLMVPRPWCSNAVFRYLLFRLQGVHPSLRIGSYGAPVGEPLQFLCLAFTQVPAKK